jgi:hypothetical protein
MIELNISFPLESSGFFRRECPFCCREFKILLKQNELNSLSEESLRSFMLEKNEGTSENQLESNDFFCPYCGQAAKNDKWWTKEQAAYIHVYMNNIISGLINDHFIKPLKSDFSSSKNIKFEGKEMELKEPWISPESNDMIESDLPCCQRRIKVDEKWAGDVFCFFCGFPHKRR